MKTYTSLLMTVALALPLPVLGGSMHPDVPREAALIPGCPATDNGELSECLRRRAAWGAYLYEQGEVGAFITSGSAVYNRYVEAEALAAALVHYGVPAERIFTETQALHTDENVAYGALLAKHIGVERLVIATDAMQVRGMMSMAEGFGVDARPAPIEIPAIRERLLAPLPAINLRPVPAGEWQTLSQREKQIAADRGVKKRPPSWLRYAQLAVVSRGDGNHPLKPVPPRSEPEPQRHLTGAD